MTVTISKAEARRHLLGYHHLFPARSLGVQAGVRTVMTRLRCIQVDPLDVVGRHVHLIMQSRVQGFGPALLDRLVYQSHELVESWDKVRSIVVCEDWANLRACIGPQGLRANRSGQTWLGVEGAAGERRAALGGVSGPVSGPAEPEQITAAFVAPLDNLLWDRRLVRELFDFEYTWEVYKPASTRTYGYYVLPVVLGDRFVARWEPRRSGQNLVVRGWWWERDARGLRDDPTAMAAVGEALAEFMAFLGVTRIAFETGVASRDRAFLRKAARTQ